MLFWFRSGSRKKQFLVCDIFMFLSRELIVFISSTIIEDIRAMRKAGLRVIGHYDTVRHGYFNSANSYDLDCS